MAEIAIFLLIIFVCSLFDKSNAKYLSHQYIPFNTKFRIRQKCYAVPEWLAQGTEPEQPAVENIRVRFINTVSGKDVVVENVPRGSNLLAVGDNAGVKLPRACRTGLCGSCTCEVQDPQAIATSSNPRDGFATIRACSTKCYVPNGLEEMVVDVHRMQRKPAKTPGVVGRDSTSSIIEDITSSDPMARFYGDWEKEFRPQWEMAKTDLSLGVGQVGGASDPRNKKTLCQRCNGVGRAVCYACGGSGKVVMDSKAVQCLTCVGMQTTGCGYCQGTGNNLRPKK